ncbi:zinc ribbon domain-containing protein [Streptomyces sp. NPDC058646]|uniref:zinc ribbon domain-containing protein n=1 Tax=Streptomyces sp. NPDC058646 TaxID=3346574 RepID=UPI00364613CE
MPPFPASRTCAACGLLDPEPRRGRGRRFACTRCGHEDDAGHPGQGAGTVTRS